MQTYSVKWRSGIHQNSVDCDGLYQILHTRAFRQIQWTPSNVVDETRIKHYKQVTPPNTLHSINNEFDHKQ